MLAGWAAALQAAAVEGVRHFIYFCGESPSLEWLQNGFDSIPCPSLRSIGECHNLGVRQADSEWVMKLDIDTLPNENFFKELLPVLQSALPCQWFNVGMIYLKRSSSTWNYGLSGRDYLGIMHDRMGHSEFSYIWPAGTNFLCRRQDYLDMGGCAPGFTGWGWEDYQQLYGLELQERGRDPLPGRLDLGNATQRCRDEIARPKARQLWEDNHWLCLLHRWHAPAPRVHTDVCHNRQMLLDWINSKRNTNPLQNAITNK